jgi:hypothetical protein
MDEEDDYRPPRHWGDYGALLLAGGVAAFTLYLIGFMFFGGHPLAMLFHEQPQQTQPAVPSEQEQLAAPFHTEPGEVVLSTRTMTPVGPAKTRPAKPKAPPHA